MAHEATGRLGRRATKKAIRLERPLDASACAQLSRSGPRIPQRNQAGEPTIVAWRCAGLGRGNPHPSLWSVALGMRLHACMFSPMSTHEALPISFHVAPFAGTVAPWIELESAEHLGGFASSRSSRFS